MKLLLYRLSYTIIKGQAGIEPASPEPQSGALPLSYCPKRSKDTGRTRTAVVAFAEQRLSSRPRYHIFPSLSSHLTFPFDIDIVTLYLLFVKSLSLEF